MVRKFLYAFALLIALVVAAAIAFRLNPQFFMRQAFVPQGRFEAQPPLATGRYADAAMWYARGGQIVDNPALWLPPGVTEDASRGKAAIFFVHPTSYVARSHWNAPIEDAEAEGRARIFLRGDASVFNRAGDVWAPRYRQAAIGAFMTSGPERDQALALARGDVFQAFDQFVSEAGERPIILAGHSQGSLHLLHLLKDRIAETPLARRIVAVYAIGWPIELSHDLPALGLPLCAGPRSTGCLISFASYAEPAQPEAMLRDYQRMTAFDGAMRGTGPIACVNPLTGAPDSAAPASANPGTLVPNGSFTSGELVAASVPARCAPDGLLLIGDPPNLGAYVLPGNNYHVYDYALFWRALRDDAWRRLAAFGDAKPEALSRSKGRAQR